jgi:Ni,Fe-hydrogenase I small subunit
VEAMPDGSIVAGLINGAVRSSEQEEMVHLLRRKSQVVIAYGACAHQGGIPGLANQFPHYTDEPDRMGEYPLRRCLHPAYAFSFRQLVNHNNDTIASWFFFISYVICPIFAVFFAIITR